MNICFIHSVSEIQIFVNNHNILGEPFDYNVRMELIEKKSKLGEGGFGSVYLAYDKMIEKEVAMKVLNFGSNSSMSHMFTKEIEALG